MHGLALERSLTKARTWTGALDNPGPTIPQRAHNLQFGLGRAHLAAGHNCLSVFIYGVCECNWLGSAPLVRLHIKTTPVILLSH